MTLDRRRAAADVLAIAVTVAVLCAVNAAIRRTARIPEGERQ
jgi:hypothetical protein